MAAALDPIRRTVRLPVAADRAFELVTTGLGAWWPREYTWSGDVLADIVIEPHAGGRCYEVGPEGFACDWGRVTDCERPARVVLRWQIAPDRTPQPDPARASEVELRLEGDRAGGTRLRLVHRLIERHGDSAEAMREGFDSPAGWTLILDRLRRAAAA